MAIKYTVHETPQPGSRKKKPLVHARALSCGTKKIDDICALVCSRSSISPADVKAVLDSMVWVIGLSLSSGNHVELENLGHFSPSLRTQKLPNGKYSVEVDGVNFRCSPKLKEEMEKTELEREKLPELRSLDVRKAQMQDYIQRNGHISIPVYAGLNACSRYRAEADIKQFIADGIIRRIGSHTHVLYITTNVKEI